MTNQDNIYNSTLTTFCLTSVNNSCPKMYTHSPLIRMSLYILLGSIIVVTVLGNSLVIITVLHFKQFHTPTNYLIMSLAVADLLVGVVTMPFFMVSTVELCWYTGPLHCKIHLGLGVMLFNASILNICFIAIDRYFAVCYPLTYQTTITTSVVAPVIFLGWSSAAIFGFCTSFLVVQNLNTQKSSPHMDMCEGVCVVHHSKLSAALPILGMYFPGAIMICVYAKIYHIAKRHARLIQNKPRRSTKMSNTLKKIEIKATRTLAIVMGVFLSLWLPFNLCNLLHPLTGYSMPLPLLTLLSWVGCFNSTCNPLIYTICYRWFRRAFIIILCGRIFQTNTSSLNFSG